MGSVMFGHWWWWWGHNFVIYMSVFNNIHNFALIYIYIIKCMSGVCSINMFICVCVCVGIFQFYLRCLVLMYIYIIIL